MNHDSSTYRSEKVETAFIELAIEMAMLDGESSEADPEVATESILRTAAALHKSLEP